MSAAAPTTNGKGEGPSLSLLIKLLKLTTSSTDAEALLAMRKANEQLTKHFGGDWEALLRSKVTVILDPFAESDARGVPTTPPRPPSHNMAPSRPGAAPPPPDYSQTKPPPYRRHTPPPQAAKPAVKGPQRGRIIANQFSKGCFICTNNVPTGTGYAIVDTEWNKRPGKWETVCQSCFDNGGKAAPFASRTVTPKPATHGLGDLA